MKHQTLPLLAGLLATTATATPDPGIFNDIKSAWDGAKYDISGAASTVQDDWDSAWASATATTTSSSASSTSTATVAQNVSSLTHPRCSADKSRSWCGLVVGGDGESGVYNISVTDSACRQVANRTGITAGNTKTTAIDTDVGNFTFGVSATSGVMSLLYNGRNISDFRTQWDSWAIEQYDPVADSIVIYGGITNCTSADDEDSSASAAAGGVGRGVAVSGVLAAVAVGVIGWL